MQSHSSPFVTFAREKKSAKEVAHLLGCNPRTAREGLREAMEFLSDRARCCEGAVQILLHSGLERPQAAHVGGFHDVNRWRAWQDVALGLARAS